MDFNIELPSVKDMGLERQGAIHKLVDVRFIHYMKEKMPIGGYNLITTVRSVVPGLIQVQSPYAHYVNEGIVYVDPQYGYGAIPLKDKYGNLTGFISRKGVKKIPSGRELNYKDAPTRGAHFVERTIAENTEDIIRDITPYLGGKK